MATMDKHLLTAIVSRMMDGVEIKLRAAVERYAREEGEWRADFDKWLDQEVKRRWMRKSAAGAGTHRRQLPASGPYPYPPLVRWPYPVTLLSNTTAEISYMCLFVKSLPEFGIHAMAQHRARADTSW